MSRLLALIVTVAAVAAGLALPAAGEAKLVITGTPGEVKQMTERLRRLCLDREIDVFQETRGSTMWVVAIGDEPPAGAPRRTPKGCKLVAELVLDTMRTVWIRHDAAYEQPSASPFVPRWAMNGRGTDGAIGWNPTDTDATYTVRGFDGEETALPLDIALAHELIHAWRFTTGRAARVDRAAPEDPEEIETIESGPLTENDIRLEQDRATGRALTPRTGHWGRIDPTTRRRLRRVSGRLPPRGAKQPLRLAGCSAGRPLGRGVG